MNKLYAILLCVTLISAAAAVVMLPFKDSSAEEEKTSSQELNKAAIKRSRKMVQMLDNIYKQTIVLITDKYVHDEDDYPAGSAAVTLFANISQSGSHQVRLIDATGDPYESENVAKDEFEREGIQRLKEGAATYEQIVREDGKAHLRVVTPVPVVMKKCIMCHDHYASAKKGEPIGAISYTVPIE